MIKLSEAVAEHLLQRDSFERKLFNKAVENRELLDKTKEIVKWDSSKSFFEKAREIINVIYSDMNGSKIQQRLIDLFCFVQGVSDEDLKFRSEMFEQFVNIFRTCAGNYFDHATGKFESFSFAC